MSIHLGLDNEAKAGLISRAASEIGASRVVMIGPERFRFDLPESITHEHVPWSEVTMYRTYYRLLREIDSGTVVVLNECLRTQDRHSLEYNCVRLFLQQTQRVAVFQYLPMIDTVEDFMTLFDFDSRSRWKSTPFDAALIQRESSVAVATPNLAIRLVDVSVTETVHDTYSKAKRELFAGLGLRDPHTIPRTLYLIGGRAKLARVNAASRYVGRNNRFKIESLTTFGAARYHEPPYTVFELPHASGEFCDFVTLSRQSTIDVLATDLKADRWYVERYLSWAGRIRDACSILRG